MSGLTKEAGFSEAIDSIGGMIGDAPDRLGEFWSKLGPDTKQTLTNTLIGGALGGGAGLGMGMLDDDKDNQMSSGGMGALLGALAGGAGTLGYQTLTGKNNMFNEPKKTDLADSAVDMAGSAAIRNPGLVLGTLAGGAWAGSRYPTLAKLRQAMHDVPVDANTGISGAGELEGVISGNRSFAHPSTGKSMSVEGPASNLLSRTADKVQRATPGVRATGAMNKIKRTVNPKAVSALRGMVNRLRAQKMIKTLGRQGSRTPWSAAALPVAAGLGYLTDRYMRGDNE